MFPRVTEASLLSKHTLRHTHTHTHLLTYTQTHSLSHTHTQSLTHIHSNTLTHSLSHSLTYTQTHSNTLTHTLTLTHTHTHTHTHTLTLTLTLTHTHTLRTEKSVWPRRQTKVQHTLRKCEFTAVSRSECVYVSRECVLLEASLNSAKSSQFFIKFFKIYLWAF